ncbi:hypothetical protein GUJ93_ZPchr0013g36182 [Zizania palustris]|uniref:Uncharacterized protein n=1 Tax=Zizania palustris TaxID=103762 RepID=A0A8J6BZQ9_ZIZPA|nr:hypothetical protein GUJ93_ZPchr0013g36182 [Zizania palustris]
MHQIRALVAHATPVPCNVCPVYTSTMRTPFTPPTRLHASMMCTLLHAGTMCGWHPRTERAPLYMRCAAVQHRPPSLAGAPPP